MEYTTRFTLVCKNTADADALNAAFSAPTGAPLETAIKDFFSARKLAIHPTDNLGFDRYERSGLVIDAAFTSGSTDVDDFIRPLSKVCHALHADLIDDEVARRLEYGFIDGKKKPPAEVVALMKTLAPTAQLGHVGKIIEAAERMENDPTYAFIRAIGFSRNQATVQALLERGADPNVKFSSGYSCLDRAITGKRVKIVQLMLEHGADANLPHDGAPPLYNACRFGMPKIVDMLLQYGADPNARDKTSPRWSYPIEIAIYENQAQAVRLLLDKGAQTSGLPKMGNLLQFTASSFDHIDENLDGKLEIFKLLTRAPELKAELAANRDALTARLRRGFKSLKSKNPKDQKDFDDILAFMAAA